MGLYINGDHTVEQVSNRNLFYSVVAIDMV